MRNDSKRSAEVNELLCFLHNKYHNHPLSLVKNTIIDFCHEDEILAAKQILVQHVSDKSLIQQYARRRIGENKNKSTLDDIINIWSVVDEHNLMNKLPIFCAADLSRIPVLSDELSDLALVRKTVVDLEVQMRSLTDCVNIIKINNQSCIDICQTRNDIMSDGSSALDIMPRTILLRHC